MEIRCSNGLSTIEDYTTLKPHSTHSVELQRLSTIEDYTTLKPHFLIDIGFKCLSTIEDYTTLKPTFAHLPEQAMFEYH